MVDLKLRTYIEFMDFKKIIDIDCRKIVLIDYSIKSVLSTTNFT